MRKTIWIIIALLVLAGLWFWLGGKESSPSEEMQESAQQQAAEQSPEGAAGIQGSENQGNLGGEASATVQQPSLVIGSNVALGTDSNDKLGTYLIAYNGMTVYTFSKDEGSVSSCYDTCAKNWPPYVVSKDDVITNLKAGVGGTVGTTVRTDGSLQLTYNGHPLYFYIKDTASGDTSGEGVNGAWAVVKP